MQQLLENYQSTVLKAVREVEDGMVAFLRSREQEQILADTEAAARRSLTIANVGYREGFSDFQRVLDAQSALLRAQQSTTSRHAAPPPAARSGSIGPWAAAGRSAWAAASSTRRQRDDAPAHRLGRSPATAGDRATIEGRGRRLAVAGLVSPVSTTKLPCRDVMTEPEKTPRAGQEAGKAPEKALRRQRRRRPRPSASIVSANPNPSPPGWTRCASGC